MNRVPAFARMTIVAELTTPTPLPTSRGDARALIRHAAIPPRAKSI